MIVNACRPDVPLLLAAYSRLWLLRTSGDVGLVVESRQHQKHCWRLLLLFATFTSHTQLQPPTR